MVVMLPLWLHAARELESLTPLPAAGVPGVEMVLRRGVHPRHPSAPPVPVTLARGARLPGRRAGRRGAGWPDVVPDCARAARLQPA